MSKRIQFIFIGLIFTFMTLYGQNVEPPHYDLENPHKVLRLPDYLEEVSGLTYYTINQLAMHNDENDGLKQMGII